MINEKSTTKSAGAGLLIAVTASLCCITPVLALISGTSGIAASFSWMEPFRPYLIVLTMGVLGFAWYLKLKPRTEADVQCDCEEDEKPSFRQSRKFLGFVTVFATLMLAFPSYAHVFYPETNQNSANVMSQDTSKVKHVVINVKGMTCAGCENHIEYSVSL